MLQLGLGGEMQRKREKEIIIPPTLSPSELKRKIPGCKFKVKFKKKLNRNLTSQATEALEEEIGVMLNRPSWLLGKWRLVNEFLNKSYRANEWIETIEFQ